MGTGTSRAACAFAAIALVLVMMPAAATASPWVTERAITGNLVPGILYATPVISGNNIVYGSTASGGHQALHWFSLTSATSSPFFSDATNPATQPQISGDWVVWSLNNDIRAKRLGTPTVRNVTNDGDTTAELSPDVSGTYVVWWANDGVSWNVRAKNLVSSAAPFTVAGGAGNQFAPSVSGKRVAYLDDSNGHPNVYVKTIGSGAAPLKITNDAVDQSDPDIGSHLVAWLVPNADGHKMIRYYDFNTGETSDGPTSATADMSAPEVSGDRILYSVSNGSDQDLYVWDTRIARLYALYDGTLLESTPTDEGSGSISGNEIAFISGDTPFWGRLAVPSISTRAVPRRIAHGARLHLRGSISDQGHRLGRVALGVERVVAGKWQRFKTITASAAGTFSYYTPRNYSKRQYRIVYDGAWVLFLPGFGNHLSTVGSARTAWPR